MIEVKRDLCTGCGQCVQDCYTNNIILDNKSKAFGKNANCIKCGHCIAICPNNAVVIHEYDMTEVQEFAQEDFKIDPKNMLNFIKFKRSTRKYLQKEVEKELIEQIIDAGRFTHTSGNRQNVSYIILKEKKAQIRVAALKCLYDMSDDYINSDSWLNKRFGKNWKKMYERFVADTNAPDELFFDAPLAILVVSDMPTNAGLVASNMANMANALGLGICFVNFFVKAVENSPEIKAILNIEQEKQLVYCMTVGYPAVKYLRTVPRAKRQISWQ